MGRWVFAIAAAAALCTGGLARAAELRATIEGDIDPDLRAEIERVIGEAERPIENRFEARRRARAAAEDAIAVLRAEGYYAYVVEPEITDADPPRPIVRIQPGPRFRLGKPAIAWQGEPPDAPIRTAAEEAVGLTPGAPGRAADVVAAEGRALVAVQKRGYADAVTQERQVIVDHADRTVQPTYRIASGPLVRLDGLQIAEGGRTNPVWLRGLAPWKEGDTYDPEDVAELERRLLDTSVYDSVTVAIAPPAKTTPEGLRPVLVSLAERKRRTVDVSASYSTTEGLGGEVRWSRYNQFRRADTLTLLARAQELDSRLGGTLSLPHWRRPQQTLRLGSALYRQVTDAYDATGVGAQADVTRRYGRTSYLTAGVSVDLSKTKELEPGTATTLGRELVTFAALGDVLLDRANDPLNPTSGYKLSGRLEPTLIVGQTNLPYLRVMAQGTYYLPFDEQARTVVAGRARIGRILNGTVDQIPAPQRFYAGGGGSVRGFPYQAVGPQIDADTPKGGTSLLELSLELRQQVTRKWGLVVFADGGSVGSSGPIDLGDLAVGAGVGLRYDLGFAPIRVDVATPVVHGRDAPSFQIYVSIGQAF